MRYILKEQYQLRGWKNRPWCICDTQSPMPAVAVGENFIKLLSETIEYTDGNPMLDRLIASGLLRAAGEKEELKEEQMYFNYGCLYFESVIFSITGRCNYHCLHCSVNAPKAPMQEIPFQQIEKMLDEMKECGLDNIVLIGGEPLIRKDFMQVVDAVLERKMFIVQIFTNGSLVDEELLDELDKRKISPLFMISFDGVGYHDIMRGVKGAEKDFYRCVDLLRSRNFRVSCNMCVTKDSIHSLWDTIMTLSAKGVSDLTVYPPVECGLWKDRYREMGASLELVSDVYTDVIEKYVAAGFPMDLYLYGLARFLKEGKKYAFLPNWRYRPEKAAASPACRIFLRELNISPEGILSPCYAIMSDDYIRSHMPDINQMSLKEALTDSAYTRIMELSSADIAAHNPKCRECEHLPLCGGGCRMSAFEKTGDMLGYDPQMCTFFEKGYLQKFREAVRKGQGDKPENFLFDLLKKL